ncbi:MAG: hypothetical protein MUD12_02650 [Spirochaetes bacterium]|jgi:hypothetical protein|nr:hypothetical protein [Spirochaetota bacterium]
MKGCGVRLAMACAVAAICLDTPAESGKITRIDSVEFRGLRAYSKFELSKGAIGSDGTGLLVDLDALGKNLSRSPFLEKYGLSMSDGKLIVTVIEKKPALLIAVRKGERVVPIELDGNFKLISAGRSHAELPVIFLGEEDLKRGRIEERARQYSALLKRVGKLSPSLLREISEIHAGSEIISVYLKGRRTRFLLRPEESGFIRLGVTAGYLDRMRRYPEVIDLLNDRVVIR